MQPGWNWRVQAPVAPQASDGAYMGARWQGPVVGAAPLRYEAGRSPSTRPTTGEPAIADTGNGPPRRMDWWQVSQTAAAPVVPLQREPNRADAAAYIPIYWSGPRAPQLGRQWNRGITGMASMMSHGWPSNDYVFRLPVAYIPAARAIWRSIRTFTQGTRSNDRQYIPAVFVPAAPVNTLGVNHAP